MSIDAGADHPRGFVEAPATESIDAETASAPTEMAMATRLRTNRMRNFPARLNPWVTSRRPVIAARGPSNGFLRHAFPQ